MEVLTPWHLLLAVLGFVLLFGSKKLPVLTRSLGSEAEVTTAESLAAELGARGGARAAR